MPLVPADYYGQAWVGALLAVRIVNAALLLMSGRYPEELVRTPLPDHVDLRKMLPVTVALSFVFAYKAGAMEDYTGIE
ncbi:hypothetical protein FB564_1108 [Salinispora arenicola]|uniref:Uncharacterized protein n=1 Tax=Salinispora arenicola TaxID=168697 RepID=A0A542XJJ5_SALAC|nr:hypothetical protein FB564_1108 [Salinispora arenicola]